MNSPLELILRGIYLIFLIIVCYLIYQQVGGITTFAIVIIFMTANFTFALLDKNIKEQKEINRMIHDLMKKLNNDVNASRIENKATALTTQMLFDIMESNK